MRSLVLLAILTTSVFGQVGLRQDTDSLLSQLNSGYRGETTVQGVRVETLYEGYWTPPEVIDPPSHTDPITDFDPLQSTFSWMYDSTSYRALVATQLAFLQTEWSTADEKYSGAFDNTFYVDWSTGDNADDGSTTGLAWKDLDYAVDYVLANHDAEATEIVLLDGVQYLDANAGDAGTGDPVGGAATVRIDNWGGVAIDPLVIRSNSGNREDCIVRIDHAWLNANFDDIKDGFPISGVELNCGIQVNGTTSYVEFWDFTLVGPQFEVPFWEKGGDAVGILATGHTGDNIEAINIAAVQWPHCGFKGDMQLYGCLADNNGTGEGNKAGATDHGVYFSDGASEPTLVGSIILNSYGNGINPRNFDISNLVIRGNIIGHSGGFGGDIGGLFSVIEHNLFINSNYQGISWDGDFAGGWLRNNVFYEDDIDLQSKPPDQYKRAIGFTWQTNAGLTGETLDSLPSLQAWPSTTEVERPANVTASGNNYVNRTTDGPVTTGSTTPACGSGTCSDDVVTWTFVNAAGNESLGVLTTIDSDDFNDFLNFDFRPASGSDLLSNATNVGYGTTIGPFNAAP